jgi:hypothetical protein
MPPNVGLALQSSIAPKSALQARCPVGNNYGLLRDKMWLSPPWPVIELPFQICAVFSIHQKRSQGTQNLKEELQNSHKIITNSNRSQTKKKILKLHFRNCQETKKKTIVNIKSF